jgi:hypothetical protein
VLDIGHHLFALQQAVDKKVLDLVHGLQQHHLHMVVQSVHLDH